MYQNLFKLMRVINRTNSRQIWAPTSEDIDHIAKIPSFHPPKKKSPHVKTIFLKLLQRIFSDAFEDTTPRPIFGPGGTSKLLDDLLINFLFNRKILDGVYVIDNASLILRLN